MSNLDKKIILYLGRTPDFIEEVVLRDDGDGSQYIFEWNAKDKEKPSDSQLNSLSDNETKEYNNEVIRATRERAYGTIGDQLDLLYKDMLAGKLDTTGEWAKAIKAVKDDNPKE